jgi:RNA-directed DNA polymerase
MKAKLKEIALVAWAIRKFKRFTAHKVRASRFLQRLARENAKLFVHWRMRPSPAK